MAEATAHIHGDATGLQQELGRAAGAVRNYDSTVTGIARRGSQQRSQQSKAELSAALLALARKEAAEKKFTKVVEDAAKQATKIVKAEQDTRVTAAADANKRIEALTKARVANEVKFEVQGLQRIRDARGRFVSAGGSGGSYGGGSAGGSARSSGGGFRRAASALRDGGLSVASDIHGQIQSQRRSDAELETEMNTILLQVGAGAEETTALRQRIIGFVRDNRLQLGQVVDSISDAQSRFNALGGSNAGERMAALNATLGAVDTARVVDPNNMSGMVSFAALLRQQGLSAEMQSDILRSATGISFQGSVETDQALRQGLPAMLRSLSTTLATTSPENRQQATRDAVVDFLAQIQSVAATGGAVGVSGARMNTLRTALSSTDTQDRIGAALARRLEREGRRRNMTDEEQAAHQARLAEFHQAFTHDSSGRYTMNQALVNSPSGAAAMFGHLFGDSPTALANFLGPRGGGGKRQLLMKPVVDLITSYFAMTTDSSGRTTRQYDAVNTLRQQTLSPERLAEMRRIRDAEEQQRLNAEENARRDALGDKDSTANRVSNWWSNFTATNPITSSVISTVTSGGTLGALFGAVRSSGGRNALRAAGRALPWIGTAAASFLGGAGVGEGLNRLTEWAGGRRHSGAEDISVFRPGALLAEAGRAIEYWMREDPSQSEQAQRARVAGVEASIAMDQGRRFTQATGGGAGVPDTMQQIVTQQFMRELRENVMGGIRDGVAQAQFQISPQVFEHARSANNTANGRPSG